MFHDPDEPRPYSPPSPSARSLAVQHVPDPAPCRVLSPEERDAYAQTLLLRDGEQVQSEAGHKALMKRRRLLGMLKKREDAEQDAAWKLRADGSRAAMAHARKAKRSGQVAPGQQEPSPEGTSSLE